jgi:hypothetical protein
MRGAGRMDTGIGVVNVPLLFPLPPNADKV